MTLSPAQVRRYARHVLLPHVGGVGQQRLLSAIVCVDTLDAAAAAAVVYLAAAGVGTLVIRDDAAVDAVDAFLFEAADLGRPRREAAAERIAALTPDTRVLADGAADPVFTLGVAPARDAVEALAHGAQAAERLIAKIVSS